MTDAHECWDDGETTCGCPAVTQAVGVVEVGDPVPALPANAPAPGTIWRTGRDARQVNVRSLTWAEGMWRVDTDSFGGSVRMGYSIEDFLAIHTPDMNIR